jgi:aminomethyltransferase
MDDAVNGPGTKVKVKCVDGSLQDAELCRLPMYDEERLIPRGKLIDIPTKPISSK